MLTVPKVLITHTLNWPNAARLAIAFRAADCRVHVLCRADHPLRSMSCVDGFHTYKLFASLDSLRLAIKNSEADIIVPCDDVAVAQLHYLHSQSRLGRDESARRMAALIERSLGKANAYDLISARSQLPSIASAVGILLPDTDVVRSVEELKQWLERHGFPAYLKTNNSWGGYGVRKVENPGQARAAFRALSRGSGFARALKQVVVDRDSHALMQKISNPKPVVSIQTSISGKLANCAVACWNGEVIASLSVEVVAASCSTGVSTVVRRVDNPQMLDTATRIARQLGISGFCGFDFVLQEGSGLAYLLEINPRATQINHLVFGAGHDLPGALRSRITGERARTPQPISSCDTIALFPQEIYRDPKSSHLLTAYHDIPFEEPALIRAYLGRAFLTDGTPGDGQGSVRTQKPVAVH